MTDAERRPLGVSFLVCTCNGADRIAATLEHLARQRVSRDVPWEVLVVDNASSDATAEVAGKAWPRHLEDRFRILVERRQGKSHALSTGISAARHGIVSIVDDDNWVAPDWVERVESIFASQPEVAMCGGPAEGVFDQPPPPWFADHQAQFAVGPQAGAAGDVTESRGWFWGAGLSIRKSALDSLQLRGFSVVLAGRRGRRLAGGSEDVEICTALRIAGWKAWYDPGLRLRHRIPRDRVTWKRLRGLYRAGGWDKPILRLYVLERRRQSGEDVAKAKSWIRRALELLGGWLRAPSFVSCLLSEGEAEVESLEFEERKGELQWHLATVWRQGAIREQIARNVEICLAVPAPGTSSVEEGAR